MGKLWENYGEKSWQVMTKWENYGKTMGKSHDKSWLNGKTMGKLWENYGEKSWQVMTKWENYGKTMGKLWGKLWENYGEKSWQVMTKWENYGKTMGKLWENYGEKSWQVMTKWENYGKTMGKLWGKLWKTMGKSHDKSWLNGETMGKLWGKTKWLSMLLKRLSILDMIIFLGIWTDWNATPRWKNGTSISRCVVGTLQNHSGRPLRFRLMNDALMVWIFGSIYIREKSGMVPSTW